MPARAATSRRAPAGAAPNVVVSGAQVYDNKGRVVEKYEPYFDTGWDYAPPAASQFGQKATLLYDARGRVVRTVNPDGSELHRGARHAGRPCDAGRFRAVAVGGLQLRR